MLSLIVTFNYVPCSHSIISEPEVPVVSKVTYFDGNYDITNVTLNAVDNTMGPIRSV